jgi:hypothetical protein
VPEVAERNGDRPTQRLVVVDDQDGRHEPI